MQAKVISLRYAQAMSPYPGNYPNAAVYEIKKPQEDEM